jgi:regulator of protease activity HflC (stomatin/prohibitin superfamily)
MTSSPSKAPVNETPGSTLPGAAILLLLLIYVPLALFGTIHFAKSGHQDGYAALTLILSIPITLLTLSGFFVIQPNTSRVLIFFGKYKGTVRQEGFHWVRPFMLKTAISLRANNVASETIKVNDLNGNPIEIGAVIVWRVADTAKAIFDVEDYEDYIGVQIETAVRELAKTHPYESHISDGDEKSSDAEHSISLRSDTDAIAKELTAELQMRLERAGIEVLEARISHLAYALEIASAMLQRQQAAAIISARRLIVEGAVGMVEQALEALESRGVVNLDDERKATMVSNLLVVLCSHAEPTPVINAGGIYN